jgi:hypothetical protein
MGHAWFIQIEEAQAAILHLSRIVVYTLHRIFNIPFEQNASPVDPEPIDLPELLFRSGIR